MGLLITSKIYIISLVTFNKYTIDVYCVADCASEMDFACMIWDMERQTEKASQKKCPEKLQIK